MTINDRVMNQLPQAPDSGWIPAYLLDSSGEVLFEFLYNPEQKDYSRRLAHAPTQTALTSVQGLHFLYAEGRELRLPNLLMESWGNKRSLRPLIEKLESLAVADVPNGKYSPTEVYFAWGSEVFGPAYLTESIDWVETLWVGGEPAEVRLNLTLKQIPSQLGAKQPTSPSQTPTDEAAAASQRLENALQVATNTYENLVNGGSSLNLTERQQQEGSAIALEWLRNNLLTVPNAVRQAYKRNTFSLQPNADGSINFLDRNNLDLGSIGTYDGSSFDPKTTS